MTIGAALLIVMIATCIAAAPSNAAVNRTYFYAGERCAEVRILPLTLQTAFQPIDYRPLNHNESNSFVQNESGQHILKN